MTGLLIERYMECRVEVGKGGRLGQKVGRWLEMLVELREVGVG